MVGEKKAHKRSANLLRQICSINSQGDLLKCYREFTILTINHVYLIATTFCGSLSTRAALILF